MIRYQVVLWALQVKPDPKHSVAMRGAARCRPFAVASSIRIMGTKILFHSLMPPRGRPCTRPTSCPRCIALDSQVRPGTSRSPSLPASPPHPLPPPHWPPPPGPSVPGCAGPARAAAMQRRLCICRASFVPRSRTRSCCSGASGGASVRPQPRSFRTCVSAPACSRTAADALLPAAAGGSQTLSSVRPVSANNRPSSSASGTLQSSSQSRRSTGMSTCNSPAAASSAAAAASACPGCRLSGPFGSAGSAERAASAILESPAALTALAPATAGSAAHGCELQRRNVFSRVCIQLKMSRALGTPPAGTACGVKGV